MRGQGREAVAAEDGQHGAHHAGHADPGSEELEDQQAAADDEEQEGDGRAGHRVEHLLDQAEAREPNQRGHVLGLALVVELLGHGVEHHTGDTAHFHHSAIHGEHHALHRRDALIRRVEPQHTEFASIGERHRAVAQPIGAGSQIHRRTLQRQQLAGVADAAAGNHGGDVGDAEQLSRRAVRPGIARLPHPDPDGDLCIGHRLQQVGHLGGADHRTARVELQDEGLGTCRLAASDGVLDGLHGDGVEQARHL